MRILLALHSLNQWGGTQVWVKVMRDALRTLGHEVDLFAVGEHRLLSDGGCDFSRRYHAALIAQNTTLRALGGRAIAKRILTCHGALHPLEQPAPGADAYAAVSEFVAQHLHALGYPAAVIPNPLPLSLPRKTDIQHPPRVAFASGTSQMLGDRKAAYDVVRAAGGENVPWLADRSPDAYHAALSEFDVLVGCGRCVLEALAIGLRAVIYDYPGGSGAITAGNFHESASFNFNGRHALRRFTPDEMRAEIDRAEPIPRAMLVRHDALDVARSYLELIAACPQEKPVPGKAKHLRRRAAPPGSRCCG